MLVARAMGFNVLFGLLSGGATAICGASAALALSAALPAHPGKERATCSDYGSWSMVCGGRCVNTYTNRNHCGGCGNACNIACSGGRCL